MGSRVVESVASVLSALPADRPLLLGLSGGADSVALFRSLLLIGRPFTAVHCDFHLRGEESERDRRFVERLCRRHGVVLDTVHFKAADYCRSSGLSLEDGCRRLRYDYFREKIRKEDYARVAVAHNADDNAETFLLALMRGAGLRGLKSMVEDNGEIVRPLLKVSRKDIESWLSEIDQDFIVDSSNLNTDFRRNFLRNEVLPLLAEKWPGVRESIGKSVSALQADFRLLEDFMNPLVESEKIDVAVLNGSSSPESILYHFIRPLGGTASQAAEMHRSLMNPRVGACWEMPGGRVVRSRDGFEKLTVALRMPDLEVLSLTLTAETLKMIRKPDGNRTLWLAEDPERFRLRFRKRGDRISPLGMKGSSLVSDIVRDARLSRSEAERVVVLEHLPTGEIVWVAGLKRSRHHLIDFNNPPKTIYKVRLRN